MKDEDYPLILEPIPPSKWRKLAACASVDPELFFPDHYQLREGVLAAKRICQSCSVRTECLNEVMETESDRFGIFGGLTPKERRQLAEAMEMNNEVLEEEAEAADTSRASVLS